ncbi:MAG: YjgP/YjgQ family permease [bacterium]|nr:YjgP/YjgQ family permease [bacterium]
MFKSFDKYILKEITSPFSIGLLVYTFTLLLNMVFILSERLIAKDVSGLTILKILIYLLPDLLSFTIPMATLMGVLAGLSRLSTDSEIVAFKTMGVNNMRILRPIMIFSVVAWLLSTYLIMYLAPEGNYRFSRLNTNIILSKSVSDIKSRAFNKDFHPYTIYFDDLDHKSGEWINVFLYSKKQGDSDTVILAERGKFVQKPREEERFISLKNAWVHTFKKNEPGSRYERTFYNRLKETVPKLNEIKQTRRSTQLLFPELVRRKQKEPKNLRFAIEFHRKFSLPFACLAMGFLALSLGISTKKGGKISGFIISLGIIFVYYTIITACRNMVLKGILSPFVGMWAADIFLLAAGIIAYYYTSKEKSINWERLFSFVDKIKKSYYKRERAAAEKPKKKKEGVVVVVKFEKFKFRLLRILDFYVIKKLVLSFFFVFISLTMVFYVVRIMELVDNVIENQVAFYYVLQYVFYYTPEIVKFVLPVSVLTSVLLTFSIMSKNNEIIAVQVSGISLYRLAFPAIILGILFSLSYFYVQEEIAPGANLKASKTMDIIRKRESRDGQEFHKNWVVGENGKFYFYDYFDTKKMKYARFNMLTLDDKFHIKKRISGTYAHWSGKNQLILEDGFERDFSENSPVNFIEFDEKRITLPEGRESFTKKIRDHRYMNIAALENYIAYLKKNGSDTRKYEAQLQSKYAFPFSSLVMVLIAIPFSFMMGNKGTLYGIGIAVGISIIFWGAFGIFSAMGSTTLLSPFLSAFAPIFIFSGVSIYLFINVKT